MSHYSIESLLTLIVYFRISLKLAILEDSKVVVRRRIEDTKVIKV